MSAGFFSNVTCQTSPYKLNMENLSHKNPIQEQAAIALPTQNSNIRRTLSADMSSPKWLQNNGFNLKKVQSSHQLQALGEEDDHGGRNDRDHSKGPAFEDIWNTIQANKRSWESILSPDDGSGSGLGPLPAPYVHPMVKRSASSLSEKSLEICTESLGSETGSDGLFLFSSSEPEESDKEHEKEVEEEKEKEVQEVVGEVKGFNSSNASEVGNGNDNSKYSGNGNSNDNSKYSGNGNGNDSYKGPTTKRSMMFPLGRPSFPPPLPSLANRDGGSNLRIRSHRRDGRLVVEAVSVPSQNCFRAQRQDGRLLLTFTDELEQDDVVDDDGSDEMVFEEEDDEKGNDDEEQGEEKTGIVIIEKELGIAGEVFNVQNSCPTLAMMSKLLLNKSTWPRSYNKNIIKTLDDEDEDEDDDEEKAEITVSQTLLPQPRVSTATAAALNNAYEYYWRRTNSPAVAVLSNPLAGHHQNNNNNNNNNIYADAPQAVGKDTKGNNNNHLLFAAHNTKGVALTQQEVVLVKAGGRRRGATSIEEKGEYLVPFMLRGCKDHKRSFFLLDPYCIATS